MTLRIFRQLRDKAGEGDGGGGALTPPVVTPPVVPPVTPPATPPGTPPTEIKFPENWKDAIPEEFRNYDGIKRIQSVPELAKAFVNAQKVVGSDKIPIPSKHATEDDWKEVFVKLGLPAKIEEYALEKPKDATFGDEFVTAVKSEFHKAGILPAQAQKIMNWFSESSKAQIAQMTSQTKAGMETELNKLKTEWGEAYDAKTALASAAVKKWGDAGTIDYLNKTGLTNSPPLIRLLAKVGELLKEDKIIGGGMGDVPLTPSEARVEANKIYGDPKHPYFDKAHPNHKAAVEEVTKLNNWMRPS